MSSFNLYDNNFGDDGGGPDTDPTPDPVDPYEDDGAPLPEDTNNFQEPGEGSSFAGQDPSVWEGRGNPEQPDQWDGVVPTTETQDTYSSRGRKRLSWHDKKMAARLRASPDYDRTLAYRFAKWKERHPNKRYEDYKQKEYDLDMLDSMLGDPDDNEADPAPENTEDVEQIVSENVTIDDYELTPAPEEEPETILTPTDQDIVAKRIVDLFTGDIKAEQYFRDFNDNFEYALNSIVSDLFTGGISAEDYFESFDNGRQSGLFESELADQIARESVLPVDELFQLTFDDILDVNTTSLSDLDFELERVVTDDYDLMISDFDGFEPDVNFFDEFDFVIE